MFLLEAACGSRPLEHDLVVLLDWVLEHWKSGTEKQFFRQWIHGFVVRTLQRRWAWF